MKSFYTKEDNKTLEAIRAALLEDGAVDVHNEYETFYGVGFDKWLRNGLADLDCTFEVKSWNHFGYGYPWHYVITLNKNN
jgi:hypothetical protein